jgi:hypothetical protein
VAAGPSAYGCTSPAPLQRMSAPALLNCCSTHSLVLPAPSRSRGTRKWPTKKRGWVVTASKSPARTSRLAQSWRGMSVRTPQPSPSPSTMPDRCAIIISASMVRLTLPCEAPPFLRTLAMRAHESCSSRRRSRCLPAAMASITLTPEVVGGHSLCDARREKRGGFASYQAIFQSDEHDCAVRLETEITSPDPYPTKSAGGTLCHPSGGNFTGNPQGSLRPNPSAETRLRTWNGSSSCCRSTRR